MREPLAEPIGNAIREICHGSEIQAWVFVKEIEVRDIVAAKVRTYFEGVITSNQREVVDELILGYVTTLREAPAPPEKPRSSNLVENTSGLPVDAVGEGLVRLGFVL